jgi:hypothetical protein
MRHWNFTAWFSTVSIILVLFGILYLFLGLKVLPVPPAVLLPWESALYGAVMMGWGATLWLAGRIAFRRDDAELKRALLAGLILWLFVEAAASAWFGVWFNAGVDGMVLVLFAVPLLYPRRSIPRHKPAP